MRDEVVLRTVDIKKHFGAVRAVDGVSLEVHRAEVYGFLGPNGSGKTTTIGMALGLIHPTAGHAEVLGQKVTPEHNAVLRRVGALVGSPSLLPFLSARQNLHLLARLHPQVTRQRVDEVLQRVGLADAADRSTGPFSTGMKQRLGLAMALLHKPELVLLDEPTNGMDPAGMREVRVLLRSLADDGATVFLSSHLLHEVEQVCDRVAVLNKGRIVAQGPVSALLGEQQVVRLRVPSPADAVAALQKLAGVQRAEANGAYVEVSGVPSEQAVAYLVSQGITPSEVLNTRPDLESLFLQLTQDVPQGAA